MKKTIEITIATDVFAAIAVFKAKDDIRYYLNGVYLETGQAGARLVGCDGHQLAVAKIDGCFPEASIILPAALVNAVKPTAKGPKFITLEFDEGEKEYDREEPHDFLPRGIILTFGEQIVIGKELDGKYPDYRRVIPSSTDGITAQFDPVYTTRIRKAESILGIRFFTGLAYNGASAALSVLNENFVVATMSLRAEPSTAAPDWVQDCLNPPALCTPQEEEVAA